VKEPDRVLLLPKKEKKEKKKKKKKKKEPDRSTAPVLVIPSA
jgi:hypothetical protein